MGPHHTNTYVPEKPTAVKAKTKTVKEIAAEIRALASEFSAIADKCKHYDKLQNVCRHPPTVGSCKWDTCPRGVEQIICSACGKG